MKFLHAADLHIDSQLKGLDALGHAPAERIRAATRDAVVLLIDTALRERVDFVVLAGDIFDGPWPDATTGAWTASQFRRLRDAEVPVFLIRGNHDAKSQIASTAPWPSNVFELSADKPETVVLDSLKTAVHGQSFARREAPDDLAGNYPPPADGRVVGLVLLAMWQIHYLNRTFIYPFRARTQGKRTPILIALMGATSNIAVGYLNGWWLFSVGPVLDESWLSDPRFLVGAALFFGGMALNVASDNTLLRLRSGRDTGYHIPQGGAFRWVSCPNYLGEIIEWCGWAIASWSPAGLAFAVWSIANLTPRALASHRWYLARFEDYPPERRALIPRLL